MFFPHGEMPKDGEMPDPVEESKDPTTDETPIEWEAWLKNQPDPVQKAYESHTTNLRTALQSERQTNKDREKDLRELAAKAEKGSDAEKRLTEMADREANAVRMADFYEQAHAAGIKNLKLAWKVLHDDESVFRYGKLNADAVRAAYPELFPAAARSNAGDGTGGNQPAKQSIDQQIRAASGRA